MKKHTKILIITLCILGFLIGSIIILTILAFGGGGTMPKSNVKIQSLENICIHFDYNRGSGEFINLFSFNCDKEPNWANYYVFNKPENPILGIVSTNECTSVFMDKDVVVMEQTIWCKLFRPNYPDVKLLKYEINQKGEFKEIYRK
jgi:hypothetical protein